MKTKFIFFFFILANCLLQTVTLFSQSAERSVISSFGFSFSEATIQNDCTVGEVITATGINGGTIITQGFQQPMFASSSCLGDFDMNGMVNVSDLLIFSSSFGCTSTCGVTDMDGNGAVNVTDLLIFTSVFGTVCA